MVRSLYARLDQRFGTKQPAFQRQRDLQNRIANFSQRFDADIMFAPAKAVMDFDSYTTPEGESLLRSARDRFSQRALANRVLFTELVAG